MCQNMHGYICTKIYLLCIWNSNLTGYHILSDMLSNMSNDIHVNRSMTTVLHRYNPVKVLSRRGVQSKLKSLYFSTFQGLHDF
jgi:hypothetical protein